MAESPGGQRSSLLAQQRDANATFAFKLFNGEKFDGAVPDFTPYTSPAGWTRRRGGRVAQLEIAYTSNGAGSGAAPDDALVTRPSPTS